MKHLIKENDYKKKKFLSISMDQELFDNETESFKLLKENFVKCRKDYVKSRIRLNCTAIMCNHEEDRIFERTFMPYMYIKEDEDLASLIKEATRKYKEICEYYDENVGISSVEYTFFVYKETNEK